jgi:hypothetical protein
LLAYTACETCLDCIESLNDRTNNHNNNNNNENSNKITEMGTNIRDKDNICLDQLKKIVHTVKEVIIDEHIWSVCVCFFKYDIYNKVERFIGPIRRWRF